VVFAPLLQSVPKIAWGPRKKKIPPAKNIKKKAKIPTLYKPRRQVFYFFLFLFFFKEPYKPAIPSSKKIILPIYKQINPAFMSPSLALSIIYFFEKLA
jgi:hypothetical protein